MFGYLYIYIIVSAFIGFGLGFFLKKENLKTHKLQLDQENEKNIRNAEKKIYESEKKAREIETTAESKSKDIILDAKDRANKISIEIEKKQVIVDEQKKALDDSFRKNKTERDNIEKEKLKIKNQENVVNEKIASLDKKLEEISQLSKEEAKDILIKSIEKQSEEDLLRRMKIAEEEINTTVDEKAKNIIVHAIQKYASEVTSEATQTAVNLPDDDMKGRIIGREGRNINAFERITGVDVIIDDTPGMVIISGYDLLRRFIAKKSLEKLIEDGRIHPARIEEVVIKTTEETGKILFELGKKALDEVEITGLPDEIIKTLGRLRFRTSHGQNVLRHSIEMAFLAEEIANQIGADAERAKLAALLHDLGKSVSHEVGGRHAVISGELGRKFGLDPMVINAMEAHHEDVEKLCIEAYIVQAADAISASRPGARRDSTEQFVKRMKKQEKIVKDFEGVEKCYIMSAGRDMWVFVDPDKVNDYEAKKMSKAIAKKLEEDLNYPGEIKIVVFRETRVESIAH